MRHFVPGVPNVAHGMTGRARRRDLGEGAPPLGAEISSPAVLRCTIPPKIVHDLASGSRAARSKQGRRIDGLDVVGGGVFGAAFANRFANRRSTAASGEGRPGIALQRCG